MNFSIEKQLFNKNLNIFDLEVIDFVIESLCKIQRKFSKYSYKRRADAYVIWRLYKVYEFGKDRYRRKNIEKANDNLLKAQAIITELDITLNMDIEISKNMHSLYDFALSRLVDANLKKDASLIDDAKSVIVDLRDAWKEAMNIVKRGKWWTTMKNLCL